MTIVKTAGRLDKSNIAKVRVAMAKFIPDYLNANKVSERVAVKAFIKASEIDPNVLTLIAAEWHWRQVKNKLNLPYGNGKSPRVMSKYIRSIKQARVIPSPSTRAFDDMTQSQLRTMYEQVKNLEEDNKILKEVLAVAEREAQTAAENARKISREMTDMQLRHKEELDVAVAAMHVYRSLKKHFAAKERGENITLSLDKQGFVTTNQIVGGN